MLSSSRMRELFDALSAELARDAVRGERFWLAGP